MPIPITGGVWPAMLTALNEDQTPGLAALDEMVELFVKQGLGGIYLLGSTGHGPALPLEHRKIVAKRVIKTCKGRLPVMVHVGAMATEDAIMLAKHAADAGADAISAIPPQYFPADAAIIFTHYRRIAEATKLPFYPYHTGFTGPKVPPPHEYAKQVMELPHAEGMKVTEGNHWLTELLVEYSHGKLKIFSGADELILQGVTSGACGAIGSFYNVWGPAVKKIRERFIAGELDAGKKFMLVFGRVLYEIVSDYSRMYTFMQKAMKRKYKINIGPGRTPFAAMRGQISDKDVARMLDEVDAAAGL